MKKNSKSFYFIRKCYFFRKNGVLFCSSHPQVGVQFCSSHPKVKGGFGSRFAHHIQRWGVHFCSSLQKWPHSCWMDEQNWTPHLRMWWANLNPNPHLTFGCDEQKWTPYLWMWWAKYDPILSKKIVFPYELKWFAIFFNDIFALY